MTRQCPACAWPNPGRSGALWASCLVCRLAQVLFVCSWPTSGGLPCRQSPAGRHVFCRGEAPAASRRMHARAGNSAQGRVKNHNGNMPCRSAACLSAQGMRHGGMPAACLNMPRHGQAARAAGGCGGRGLGLGWGGGLGWGSLKADQKMVSSGPLFQAGCQTHQCFLPSALCRVWFDAGVRYGSVPCVNRLWVLLIIIVCDK